MVEMVNERFNGAIASVLMGQCAYSFLTDAREPEDRGMEGADRSLPLVLPLYEAPLSPGQEQLRIVVISSPNWVRETIHDLHGRGFANAKDWSSLVPGANPGEVVSILTRRRSRR